jgi:predicted CoA-substrate-specific enzyme activase
VRVFGGVDCGSWNTKTALVDEGGHLLATAVVRTGADLEGASERSVAEALSRASVDRAQLASVWSTGFGRHAVKIADGTRTEIDSHARGTLHFFHGPLTVIDIGGQDAKVIVIDGEGRRVSHKMQRKCASGTGSFLEEIALRLDIRIAELPALAARATEDIKLGSFCTVFTGTEVLALIRQGKHPADLARAAYRSVVKRVLEMERIDGKVVATGGVVAHHPMVVQMLAEATGSEVSIPEHAQEIGALGAALSARAAALAPAGPEGAAEGASKGAAEGASKGAAA